MHPRHGAAFSRVCQEVPSPLANPSYQIPRRTNCRSLLTSGERLFASPAAATAAPGSSQLVTRVTSPAAAAQFQWPSGNTLPLLLRLWTLDFGLWTEALAF